MLRARNFPMAPLFRIRQRDHIAQSLNPKFVQPALSRNNVDANHDFVRAGALQITKPPDADFLQTGQHARPDGMGLENFAASSTEGWQ